MRRRRGDAVEQGALDVALERTDHVVDARDFGHREGAVHGVHGAQQVVGHARRAGVGFAAPLLDGLQVAGDLGLEDLEQHRINRGEGQGLANGLGLRCGGAGVRGRGRIDGLVGQHGLQFGAQVQAGELRRGVPGLFAGSEAFGHGLEAFDVGTVAGLATQRGQQQRQHVERALDQVLHRRAGGDGLVQHAVEHVLDLPRELAQHQRADQSAAALEGVEHAAQRLEVVQRVGLGQPHRQQRFEVADFFLHLLDEDLADLLVDVAVVAVEPDDLRQLRHRRRGADGFGGLEAGHVVRGRRRLHGVGRGLADQQVAQVAARHHVDRRQPVERVLRRRLRNVGTQRGVLGRRQVVAGGVRRGGGKGVQRGRFDRGGRRRLFDRGRRRRRGRVDGERLVVGLVGFSGVGLLGNRPVAQQRHAAFGHFEDALAPGAVVAQGFEEVFKAGQRIGQGVHLAGVGHAAVAQQFDLGEAAHRGEVLRRQLHVEDAQRAGHFLQQARHVLQLGVVPVGFDEGHEALLGLLEVAVGFLHHGFEHALGLGLRQHGAARNRHLLRGRAQVLHLVVQRGFDVEQRAGDVEQRRFGGRALAAGDAVQRLALVLHHAARDAKTQHAEGVAHPVQHVGLRLQPGGVGAGVAQMQVQRVLDPQQVFLDRARHGVKQRAVVAGHAAAGVRQLFLARHQRGQAEHVLQLAHAPVVGVHVGDEIQQRAGEFARRIDAERGFAGLGQALDLAFHLADGLAQLLRGLEGLHAQGFQHAGRDPEQAAGLFLRGDGHQPVADLGEAGDAGVGLDAAEPAEQRGLELRAQLTRHLAQLQLRQGLGRAAGRGRQRTRQVRGEQRALGQALLAARGAQVVEQRQQHHRDVLVAALQALEVVGQLHDAAHQHGIRLVAVLHAAVQQRAGEVLHLLGHHRRAVQLDHAQGALHLVQVGCAEAHLAGVGRILDVGLQRVARLLEGFVQFALDPAQGGEIEIVLQPHAGVSCVLRTYAKVWRPPVRLSCG